MQINDLSGYYDKLSQIRNKVLSKHKDRGLDYTSKFSNQNVPSHRHHRAQRYTQRGDFESRRPLESKVDKDGNIMNRVKQLDTVNDKIKLILANKREPSVSQGLSHQLINSSLKKTFETTPRRMTSLFNNENEIVESKVEAPKNWIISKEKYKVETPIAMTQNEKQSESQLFSDEKVETQPKRQFLSKKEYLSDFPQELDRLEKKFTIGPEPDKNVEISKRQTFSFNLKDSLPKADCIQPVGHVNGYHKKPVTKKLICLLLKQIELDSKLRESKEKFNNFNNSDKMSCLKDKIQTFGIKMSDVQLERWIYIAPQQCNPFADYSQQTTFDYDALAARFVASWEHWTNHVQESVNIEGLQDEEFKIQEIDLGLRGYLTLEDFVCFINLHADSCFRNRDVAGMFRRWNQLYPKEKLENKLQYQVFLNFVAK